MDADELDPDPFVQFASWYDGVVAAGLPEPSAMVLSTAGADGRPVGRHVLLRGHGPDGFVFFTNYESRKGRQLAENPYASLTFPWYPIHRQAIVTGPVERVTAEESDVYFASRARESQLGAWASEQSAEIPSRAWLDDRYAELDARYAGTTVPRPPHWGGYRLRPDAIELWQQGPNRLHDRFRYTRDGDGWRLTRLSP
jgi:pyridoxamine 5'-phosphate oxidase